MPNRTITVPVLPVPDTPNANGVLFKGDMVKDAIDAYMKLPVKHIMLQTTTQVGDSKADIDLEKLCGNVDDIEYNEETKSYMATIKLIPNKNSGLVLTALAEGNNFSVGTNKMGMISEVIEGEVNEYPDGTRYVCDSKFDILSTSLIPDSVLQEVKDANNTEAT
jgi:hypothetical protein